MAHVLKAGLTVLERNYRVARGPNARGGEIDLIARDRDGTLVFMEVRSRRSADYGNAAATVGHSKQRRLVFAAQHYLLAHHPKSTQQPPCRFDVLAITGSELTWIQGAFDASGA